MRAENRTNEELLDAARHGPACGFHSFNALGRVTSSR